MVRASRRYAVKASINGALASSSCCAISVNLGVSLSGHEKADKNAEQERDSPPPRNERIRRKARAEERGTQRSQQEAGADADLLPGADETAPSFLCVFHD